MSYRDRINAVVQNLGAQLGTPLSLDANGALSLEFGDGHHCSVTVSDAEARVSLFAPVASVHADIRVPLFEAALRLNADPARTGGGIVGYDPDQRELIVTTNLDGEVDLDRLSGTLNDFLRSALALQRKLNEALQAHRLEGAAETAESIDYATGGMIKA